ncbi:hypothetical protein AMTR_s00074p00135680 [Amborella trichopoda]|uniref:Uncharacterized protein n=1 Tax=Amborella trichopoda TaxID=13333 RepID=W1NQ73_AMBTC|nr:hypothetical protein AMTR_s00074p00135680 [Amborella trichopoda]
MEPLLEEMLNSRKCIEEIMLLKEDLSLTSQLEQLLSTLWVARETHSDISSYYLVGQASATPIYPHLPPSGQGETNAVILYPRFMEEDQ